MFQEWVDVPVSVEDILPAVVVEVDQMCSPFDNEPLRALDPDAFRDVLEQSSPRLR